MPRYGITFWRASPFLRLLIPLTGGILFAHYIHTSSFFISCVFFTSLLGIASFWLFTVHKKYHWRWLNGIAFQLLPFCIGLQLVQLKNNTRQQNWIGSYADSVITLQCIVQEPLTEKPATFKTIARAAAVRINNEWRKTSGKLIVYLKKENNPASIHYGSEIIVRKKLQPITNNDNPGSFDYRQYCAFQDIYYQVYLSKGEYIVTGNRFTNAFTEWLFQTRDTILQLFRRWVPGAAESAVAEALLIGYRNDLDKELTLAYSNTGVVHIIAISGLHLGMIYGLMLVLLKPFRKFKCVRWIKPVSILLVLWGFSLLAGAAASILRSAVMFSFIIIGESIGRRTTIYNTLAASAFCLLVYNPYFLWDAGFQLSYTAVLGILIFMKPLYRSLYFENKLLNKIWQLNAVTLSAQTLTLPVILYYFHQFPNLFLFTNFIAVPLSGFILYAELLLLLVYKIPLLNSCTGHSVSFLIHQMNGVIERTSRLPFAVTSQIAFDGSLAFLVYGFIFFAARWLMEKRTRALVTATGFLFCILLLRSITFIKHSGQQKLIVYNTPKQSSIDILEGSHAVFLGNQNPAVQQVLLPARTFMGVVGADTLYHTIIHYPLIAGVHKKIWIINQNFQPEEISSPVAVNLVLLSGNPNIPLPQLAGLFHCKEYVFDSSNPLWKIQKWKKEADSLHLRHHSVPEQGAFVTDL